eukprot:m.52483 g.52483  ORF g.52483 m.52483 type:complete len:571 (-) comp13506_c0_seq1:58-1770(-)
MASSQDLESFRHQWSSELQTQRVSENDQPIPTASHDVAFDASFDNPSQQQAVTDSPSRSHAGATTEQSELLRDLIADLDEVNEEPLMDSLPQEVAALVFQYLDLPSLMVCSLVCRDLHAIVYQQDIIWHKMAIRLGYVLASDPAVPEDGWLSFVRRRLSRQRERRQRWVQLNAQFSELRVVSHRQNASSIHITRDYITAAYGDLPQLLRWRCNDPTKTPMKVNVAGGYVKCLQTHEDIIATASEGGDVSIMSAADNTQLGAFHYATPATLLSLSTNKLVAGGIDAIRFYTPDTYSGSDGTWSQRWQQQVPGHLQELHALDGQVVACLTSSCVELRSVLDGSVSATLLDDVGLQFRSWAFQQCRSTLAYALSEPTRHCARLHAVETGQLLQTLSHHGRAVDALHLRPNEVAMGGRGTGVRVYDLRSNTEAQALAQGYRDYQVQKVLVDDWRVVTYEELLMDLGIGQVVVTDRRMNRKLWHINRNYNCLSQLYFDDDRLIYATLDSNGQPDTALHALDPKHALHVFDFQHVPLGLSHQSCPYSSVYEEAFGAWNYNIALETPYENVDADRLG